MGGIKAADVSNGSNLKRQQWATEAPAWFHANHGLCLEGRCQNTACVAHNQIVIMSGGYAKFDLVSQQIIPHAESTTTTAAGPTVPKCPMCMRYVMAEKCAFNNCWWKFTGVKDNDQQYSSNWTHADNAYHYFDEQQGEKIIWYELTLEVVKDRPTAS
jgi:hypothetical protein